MTMPPTTHEADPGALPLTPRGPARRTVVGRRREDEGVAAEDLRALIQAETKARESEQRHNDRRLGELEAEAKRARTRITYWSGALAVLLLALAVFGRHIPSPW